MDVTGTLVCKYRAAAHLAWLYGLHNAEEIVNYLTYMRKYSRVLRLKEPIKEPDAVRNRICHDWHKCCSRRA